LRPGRATSDLLRRFLAFWGLELAGRETAARRRAFLETLEEWAVADFEPPSGEPFSAMGVIFSRDRALQLHALLEGWAACVRGPAELVVLWTASDPDHEASYRELSALWEGRARFLRETSFREDLLDEIGSTPATHLFFLTDDAMVLNPFDLSSCLLPDPTRAVFSLTHGRGLDWCFVARKPQGIPALSDARNGRLSWVWKDGDPGTDWSLPLSVDGKFLSRREVALLLSRLPFRNPNTLEMALQVFHPLFARRNGVCFGHPALVNVPCNTVQTECVNPDTGLHGVRDLLFRWRAGERIRWEAFLGLSPREAETKNFEFVTRS
jgi:hypothetical protein